MQLRNLPTMEVRSVGGNDCFQAFAICGEFPGLYEYELADDPMGNQSVIVEELGSGGAVSSLSATNHSDCPVLFLEGQFLIGAKQDRMLNSSVLLPGLSQCTLPVSCVERQRWSSNSGPFVSSGQRAGIRLRCSLQKSMVPADQEEVEHLSDQVSDQDRVWQEVLMEQKELGVTSRTERQADTVEALRESLEQSREDFHLPGDAVGFAVQIGQEAGMMELFGRNSICRSVWQQTVLHLQLDALRATQPARPIAVSKALVEQCVEAIPNLQWTHGRAVAAGEEFQLMSPGDGLAHGGITAGHSLFIEDQLLHLSLILSV